MIALMMFLFLSGGAKKAAPKAPPRSVYLDPDYTAYEYPFRVDADGKEYYETQLPVVSVANDGSKSVKLSKAEYSHLQELRKAVADEEQRLAVKYGANMTGCDPRVINLCMGVQPTTTRTTGSSC